MKSREAIIGLLRGLKPDLEMAYGIRDLALFGSVARGEVDAANDVDILVDVDPSIGLRFVALAEKIELALGEKVDLVSMRAVSPAMMRHIEEDLVHV